MKSVHRMKAKNLLIQLVFLSVVVLATGCASFEVRPPANSVAIPKLSKPIPVAVAMSQTDQKLAGGFSDLMIGFKRALDESGTFQTVYYPTRTGDQVDGALQLRLTAKMKADPALFPKAFLTGFFMLIPAPAVRYNHKFEAECAMDVMRGDTKVKTYTAKGTAIASHKIFASASDIEAEATSAAAKLLYNDLLLQLQKDGEFLSAELKR